MSVKSACQSPSKGFLHALATLEAGSVGRVNALDSAISTAQIHKYVLAFLLY